MGVDKGSDGRGIYRAIYTNLWDDPDFRSLPIEAKFVFLNLRTSPLSNMPGIFIFYLEPIAKQTGFTKNRIKRALEVLCRGQWIVIEDGILWVKNALKYDPNISLRNPKHVEAIKKILLGLPKSKLVKDFCIYYGIDLPYAIPNREGMAYRMPITDTDTDTDTEPDIKEQANAPFLLPTKEEIQEASEPKLKEDIEQVCSRLFKEKIFPEVNAFKNKMLKEKKNLRSILHTLCRAYIKREFEDGPWAYCQKVIESEDRKYNARDYGKTLVPEGPAPDWIKEAVQKGWT